MTRPRIYHITLDRCIFPYIHKGNNTGRIYNSVCSATEQSLLGAITDAALEAPPADKRIFQLLPGR